MLGVAGAEFNIYSAEKPPLPLYAQDKDSYFQFYRRLKDIYR